MRYDSVYILKINIASAIKWENWVKEKIKLSFAENMTECEVPLQIKYQN